MNLRLLERLLFCVSVSEMADGEGQRFVAPLVLHDGNVAIKWKTFKSQFEVYRAAKKFSEMTDGEQVANLLLLMGPSCVSIYEQFVFENQATDKKTDNVIFERVKCNSMRQGNCKRMKLEVVSLKRKHRNVSIIL